MEITADSTNAGKERVSDGTAPCLIISIISCFVDQDLPKSKVKADFTISQYCKNQGRSKPSSRLSSSICLAVACFPNIMRVGSGETRLKRINMIKQTPKRIGIMYSNLRIE